jgi:hypothetical protein
LLLAVKVILLALVLFVKTRREVVRVLRRILVHVLRVLLLLLHVILMDKMGRVVG